MMESPRSRHPEFGNQLNKTVEVLDARNPIPPSIDGGGYQGMIFGPLAGQPSNDLSNSVGFSIGGFLVLQIGVVLMTALFNTIMFIASMVARDSFNLPDNVIHYVLFPLSGYTFASLILRHPNARIISLIYFGLMSLYYLIITMLIFSNHGTNDIYSQSKVGLYLFVTLVSVVSLIYIYFSKRVRITYSRPSA